MKQKFLLLISLVLIAVQGWALPVDESSARAIVQEFINSKNGHSLNSTPSPHGSGLQLVHAELSRVNVTQNAYYIYNTGESFVITSGDDRAVSILGYGDGDFDMNNLPCGLKAMLNIYKEQIDYLLEHPELEVEKPSMKAPMFRGTSVEPLLKSEWDQMAPYGNKCPLYNNSRCVTGCACTSLCQVMYYWKYPTAATPTIPSYTTETYQISVPELPSITFDWANMKDCYYLNYSPNYTTVQANAVAWLMRYVGQAEEMDYSPYGSGAYDSDILRAAKLFGYNRHADLIYEWGWDEDLWTGIISSELYYYHRPVIYGANDDNSNLGHSFVIDGYKTDNEYNVSYHINWGWGGACNGYFVFHAFNVSGLQFNSYQTMIYNLKPQEPEIEVEPYPSIWFHVVQGETKKVNIKITGYALTGNLTAKIDDADGVFSIDKNHITKNEAMNGTTITVTYNPAEAGHQLAHLTISGGGAPAQTVELSGAADSPIITVNPSSLSFVAYTGETVTKTFNVTTNFSNSDLSLKLNNSNGIYSIDKTSISKSDAINGATVTVTYKPTEAGSSSASITISGGDAQPKTVIISGNAPEIMVSPTSLDFGQVKLNETKSLTFSVTGTGLTGDLTVSSSNSQFTVSPATINSSKAASGAIVTVTFKPTYQGTTNTSITVSGGGAVSKKINLSGKGINPTITVTDTLSFSTYPNQIVRKTFSVRGNDLTEDLTLTLNDTTGIYSINKTIITQSEAMSNAIPQVTVTYAPTEVGATTASITISGGGAEPKTVILNGAAVKPEITVNPSSFSFVACLGETVTKKFIVKGNHLLSNIMLTLNDESGNYSIDKTSISKSDATNGDTVTVSFCPTKPGTSTANVIVSSGGYNHILGAEPKTLNMTGSTLDVDVNSLSFESTYTGYQTSRTITITCPNLPDNLQLSLSNDGTGSFGLSKSVITPEAAAAGASVTVYFSPTTGGGKHARLNICYDGCKVVTIPVSGVGIKSDGYITAWPTSLEFEAQPGSTVTKTFNVSYSYPNGSIMISSVGGNGESGSNGNGGSEGALQSLNTAISGLSWANTTIIPFDGTIEWRRKDFIDPILPVLFKSLVLEVTGDECFEVTPSKISFRSVPHSATVTVTYHPDYVGEHDAVLTIKLSGGSAKPFIMPLHGTATSQLNAPSFDNDGNDLMITQSGSSINTLVDEMLMNIKVYAEGQSIIIECPEADNAIISDIAGHAWRVNLQAGRNEIPVNASGIYIVRIREKITKLMLK